MKPDKSVVESIAETLGVLIAITLVCGIPTICILIIIWAVKHL